MNEKIILYSTGCPKCTVLKKKLEEKNILYYLVTDADEMLGLGFTTVPRLRVGDKLMDFAEAVRWVNNYHEEA